MKISFLVKQQGVTAEHPTDQADANFQFGPGKRLLFVGLYFISILIII